MCVFFSAAQSVMGLVASRRRHVGGGGPLCHSLSGDQYALLSSYGELRVFDIAVEGEEKAQREEEENTPMLWSQEVKYKEKQKGWLGGLFGNDPAEIATLFQHRAGEKMANNNNSNNASVAGNTNDKVSQVKAVMEQNIVKLHERGEVVEEVADKAQELEMQSSQLAENIKKLRKKQEQNKLFGFL